MDETRRTHAWYWIRLEMAVALAGLPLVALGLVASPTYFGPMFDRSPWYGDLIQPAGGAMYVLAVFWMWRIGWPREERAQRIWRYRDW